MVLFAKIQQQVTQIIIMKYHSALSYSVIKALEVLFIGMHNTGKYL